MKQILLFLCCGLVTITPAAAQTKDSIASVDGYQYAERAVQEKQHQIQQADMAAKVVLEDKRKQLVSLATQNSKTEAEARAYGIQTAMDAMGKVDARTLQALASVGMKPEQLIAVAFQELAGRADKIGQLNISPDLLRELMQKKP